jgi:hypothetical protein
MQDVHAPGLVSMTCCSIEAEAPVRISPATVSTCSTYLVLSVLPAPDSPEMRMHWFLRFAMSSLKALVATPKICGLLSLPALNPSSMLIL